MTTVPTTAPATYDYRYGDSVTRVTLPLRNPHTYTKGQQALVDTAVANGWTLDQTAILNTHGWGNFSAYTPEQKRRYLIQHPFKFTRPATDGGRWEIELDYQDRDYSLYASFNATLKGAKLARYTADGEKVVYNPALSGWTSTPTRGGLVLEKQSTARWASVNYVTAAASGATLREQVVSLLADPEHVVARALQDLAAAEAAEAAQRAENDRIKALKARPLPEGWSALSEAARAVSEADGMSDTAALLVALKAAVAAVEGEVVVR